ncbi:hypothetical protein PYW08_005875 [Mythimna loreyi]|uniref:Uncharacterized protein n=1 Tax=Mythimna loreyi TaxID=667449 RepID=A0ACC2QJ05_9NEOP|nr:hypothetical protein PYW08_005875 [Mythimna loreyi]
MDMRVLLVLLWKHAVVRKRRFIHTAVDYVASVLVFLILLAYKDKIKNLQIEDPFEKKTADMDVLRLSDATTGPYKLLYHPESLLTNSLMDDVGDKLMLRRLSSDSKLRYPYYEEDPKPNEEDPKPKEIETIEDQLPPIPADEDTNSINVTEKDMRKFNSKLVKWVRNLQVQEKVKAESLVAKDAQQRQKAEEAARVEKQRQKEEKMSSTAVGLQASSSPREPEADVRRELEEDQFEWDHAEEGIMPERRLAPEGAAFNAETFGQALGEDMLQLDDMSSLSNSFMKDIGAQLKLQRFASSFNSKGKGVIALARGSQPSDLVTDMKIMDAVVIFHGMSGETWPERLNYTIRMKQHFHTGTYEALDDSMVPQGDFGLKYGLFMRIQWAIDTSYIKRLTGKDVPLRLSAEEFPLTEKRNVKIIHALICLCQPILCWLALSLTFIFLTSRLVLERASGIRELMKMVGVSLNTLGISHYINVLPCGLIFATGVTACLKATSDPLIPKTNPVLIWLVLFLYFNTVVAMAFVCSYFPRGTQHVTAIAVFAYLLSFVVTTVISRRELPYPAELASGFMPHMPYNWFWKDVLVLEYVGIGANFKNIKLTFNRDKISMRTALIFMLLQCVLYYFISWYLSLVRPGQYGQALPWNFCFKNKYKVKQTEMDEEEQKNNDPRYFEPAPKNVEVGIKVVNVSKVYPKHRALKNVSLEVYKGEITVLVGHNGAGKTTLMYVITGMTSATEGKVYVNEMDTMTQNKQVRKNLGFCPQHNLFFDDLTLQEHIMFFTLLKKGTLGQARTSSRQLAEDLHLSDKLGALTRQLSGGMKRRAQLACALAGDANVLVLDEPTSGLDVETRRELWDLLLSLRGDRTVLLTTHFMEEADALGDRVAAVHQGKLRCFATPMHLKKAIGTGYRLSFTTIGSPKEGEITALVKTHVPEAMLKEQTKNTLTYSLPAKESGKFPELFSALEANRSELGLDSIGVGVSTLEEVFLKLCSDVDTLKDEDEVDIAEESKPPPKKLSGILLYLRQLYVLLKRQLKFTLYRKWMFLILPAEEANPTSDMNLDIYEDRENNKLLYHVEGPHVTQADVDKLRARYPKVTFEEADDVTKTLLRISETDKSEYYKYLLGVEVNETDAKIQYSTAVRHAAPVALNLLSNLLAAHYISWSDGKSITTMNDPIVELSDETVLVPKSIIMLMFYGIMIGFICLATNINSISLTCQERQTGSRHIHIMSGCPAELHWLATLSFHMILFMLGILIPVVVSARFVDEDNTFNQTDFLVAMSAVLVVGSLAFFALCYLVSFNFNVRNTNIVLITIIFVFVMLTPPSEAGEETNPNAKKSRWAYILRVLEYLVTPHTMSSTVLNCVTFARIKAICKPYKKYCTKEIQDTDCCNTKNCYFCLKKNNPGRGMLIMLVQFLVMMTMVILTERGVFNGLMNKVMNRRYKPTQPADQDQMVRAEKEYVSQTITKPVKEIPDALLADNLHKNYVACCCCCRKDVNALKGVSFSVKKGECFGLLGVNGAGKSTCFKLITAEESATRGNIFGNGYHLRRGTSKYLQTLGYCPQFFGLDMFLTGKDNLEMVMTLRGYDKNQVEEEVNKWINIVGLEKYAQQHVDGYSGGCVRRLGAAAALCGSAQLTLLDEPSAGVDVAARRRLWAALRKGLRQQRAIVISSHSMDEMEALCSRIAILAGGEMRALDTAAGLRAAHAQGHAVVFKLTNAQQGTETEGPTQLNKLKAKLQKTFNCTLKDEHKTMLHYHINETMQYSDLFAKLESLRAKYPDLIEDYSVTETTLEEVFLSFAKEQHERENREKGGKAQGRV